MKHCHRAALLAAFFLTFVFFELCSTVQKPDEVNVLDDYPPALLGVSHLNVVSRFGGTLLPRDVTFIFEPSSNTTKFHHKMLGDNIWVHLSQENRAVMRKAMQSYLDSFIQHTLSQEQANRKGFFGTTDVYMTWGLFGTSHEAYPTLRFEYQFITPSRPYFIIATATTEGSGESNSPALRIAVSPLQCKDILAFIEEKNLRELTEKIKSEYEKFGSTDELSATDGLSTIEKIERNANETDVPTEQSSVPFDTF